MGRWLLTVTNRWTAFSPNTSNLGVEQNQITHSSEDDRLFVGFYPHSPISICYVDGWIVDMHRASPISQSGTLINTTLSFKIGLHKNPTNSFFSTYFPENILKAKPILLPIGRGLKKGRLIYVTSHTPWCFYWVSKLF